MKFVSLFKNKAFRTTLMIGLFLTSVLIILAMLLGNESGNFVIQVESGDVEKSIGVTENIDDNVYPNKLIVKGMNGISDNTPLYFLGNSYDEQLASLKELTAEPGRKVIDDNLYVYTFYIVNTGNGALNIEIDMTASNVTKGMDEAVRIMTYNETDEEIHIYQKEDTVSNVQYDKYFISGTESFISDNRVYHEEAILKSGTTENREYIKYSILFWLEGQDPECIDDIKEGTIKFAINIKVAL